MWLKKVFEDRNLKSTDKNIAWAISSYMNADSRQAWPSHKRLAQMCGVGIRTSEYGTRNLEVAGYLTVSRKASCNNRYEMTIPHALAVSETVRDTPIPHVHAVDTAQACGMIPHVPAPEPLTEPSIEPFIEAPPPSSFGNDAVVAKEEKKGVGEEGSGLPAWTIPSLEEIPYTPELRKLYERAEEEVYTPGPVPQRHWCKRKQTREEFDAEMAARGINMDASRRRLGATAQW
jgi:hypothetical protein